MSSVRRGTLGPAITSGLCMLLSVARIAAQAPVVGDASRLTLAEVFQTLETRSPRLEAARQMSLAAEARIKPASTLADPQIQFGLMNRNLPGLGLQDPLGMYQVQVMQMVPIAGLASDLLVLARSDAVVPLEHVATVDFRGLVYRVAERFESAAASRGVRLEVEAEEATVSGNERMLERVVSNLVDNAVKHARQGGSVAITLARKGGPVLTVRDDGAGLPAEFLPHLFVRFFRGDPARRRDEGTGLGLAIAKAGAEAHGGGLEFVGNAPGAVFKLALPPAPR